MINLADTVKYSDELKLICLFDDDDTRTITFDNPKFDVDKSSILFLQTQMVENQPIIGDKTGANFVKFSRAYTINKTIYKLDLTR